MAPRKKQKTGASSSSRRASTGTTSQPPPQPPADGIIHFDRTSDQEDRFNKLSERTLTGTRFIDLDFLDHYGLLEDVRYLLGRIGWLEFIKFSGSTYGPITLEFLSSFSVTGGENAFVSFRIFNHRIVKTLPAFNKLLKLPTDGPRKVPLDWIPQTLWAQITTHGDQYRPSSSKAANIYNPVFRYLQRLLANTIFARGESTGTCRESELFFLHCMLEGTPPDTGFFLAKQLQRVGTNRSSGDIAIGGLVTIIIQQLGCDISSFTATHGESRLDLCFCLNSFLVRRHEDGIWLWYNNLPIFPLPNRTLTTIRDIANWRPPRSDAHPSRPFQESQPRPLMVIHPTPSASGPSSSSTRPPPCSDPFASFARDQAAIRESLSAIQSDVSSLRQDFSSSLDRFTTFSDDTTSNLTQLRSSLSDIHAMVSEMRGWHLHPSSPPPPPS